jgi:hypothetical protein
MDTDVVGPKENGEDAFPKTEMQIADRKEPRRDPQSSSKGVLFDSYLLKALRLGIAVHVSLSSEPERPASLEIRDRI